MPGLSMYARLLIEIFLGSVHELALTRFIVCLRRQFVHYVINSQPPRFRALLSAYADGLFVNGLEKNKCRFRGACFFRHPLHYKHIYSEMLLDFLSNVMPALCICYCFLLFLYFSLAHIKKLAFFLCTCIKTCCFPDLCYIKFERYS